MLRDIRLQANGRMDVGVHPIQYTRGHLHTTGTQTPVCADIHMLIQHRLHRFEQTYAPRFIQTQTAPPQNAPVAQGPRVSRDARVRPRSPACRKQQCNVATAQTLQSDSLCQTLLCHLPAVRL